MPEESETARPARTFTSVKCPLPSFSYRIDRTPSPTKRSSSLSWSKSRTATPEPGQMPSMRRFVSFCGGGGGGGGRAAPRGGAGGGGVGGFWRRAGAGAPDPRRESGVVEAWMRLDSVCFGREERDGEILLLRVRVREHECDPGGAFNPRPVRAKSIHDENGGPPHLPPL